jgi:hypothetical protein
MITSLIDPYGGNEMVQQQWLPWCAGCKHKLGFGFALAEISIQPSNFLASDSAARGHGMPKISHTQPS